MKELDEFIAVFTKDKLENVVKIKNSFYSLPEDLLETKQRAKKEPFSAGMFLGETRNNGFRPSASLLGWLSDHSDRKLFVNRKTAWLFLCDRDLFGKGIVRADASEGLVLVQNEADENLGYGKIVDGLEKKDKVAVENLLDRGDFLRREH